MGMEKRLQPSNINGIQQNGGIARGEGLTISTKTRAVPTDDFGENPSSNREVESMPTGERLLPSPPRPSPPDHEQVSKDSLALPVSFVAQDVLETLSMIQMPSRHREM